MVYDNLRKNQEIEEDLGCNLMVFYWIPIKYCIFVDGLKQLFPRHTRKEEVLCISCT